MNKNIKKVLVTALSVTTLLGGGAITSHADALDSNEIKDNVNYNEEIGNDVEQIKEIKENKDTSEVPNEDKEIPKENKEISEEDKDDAKVTEKEDTKSEENKDNKGTKEDSKLEENNDNKGTEEDKSKENKENTNETKNGDKKEEDSLEISKEDKKEDVGTPAPIQEDASQNIVNGLKLTNVDFVDDKDPNKVIKDLTHNYRVKMDFEVVGQIKNGDQLIFKSLMPEMVDSSGKDVNVSGFIPFRLSDNNAPTDVKALINGKEEIIGVLKGRVVKFNEKASLLNINSRLQLIFGIISSKGSSHGLRSNLSEEKEFDLNFYASMNNGRLSNPFKKTIMIPPKAKYSWKTGNSDYELTMTNSEGQTINNWGLEVSKYIRMAKEEGTGKNSTVKIRYELPDGLEFAQKDTDNAYLLFKERGSWVSKEHNEISTLFTDDSYANSSVKRVSNTVIEQTITFNKDLPDYDGFNWASNTTNLPDIIIKDKSLLKKGKDGKYTLDKTVNAKASVTGKVQEIINMKDVNVQNVDSSGTGTGSEKPDEVTKKEEDIDFATDYVKADPSLKLGYGEKKTIKEGKKGKKEIVTTTSYKTGKPVTTTKENVITPAENEVIAIGNIDTQTEETNYDIIEKEDPTLKKGETKIETKGVVGKKTTRITYEVDSKTGKLINPKEEVLEDIKPVDEVVLVGTKDAESIPYEVEYRENKNEKVGYRKTIQQGEEGIKENGKVVKEPKNEIIEIGVIKKVEPFQSTNDWIYIEVQKDKDGEIGIFKDPRKYKVGYYFKETTYYKKLDTTTGEFIEGEDYSVVTKEGGEKNIDGLRTLNYKGTISNWAEHYLTNHENGNKRIGFDPKVYDIIVKNPDYVKNYDLTTDKYVYKKAKTTYKANSELKHNEKKEITKAQDSMAHEEINFLGKTYKEIVENEAVDGITEVGNKKVEVKTEDGVTITTTTIWDVDPNTGELINPKVTVTKSTKWGTIEDIATKTEEKEINYDTVYVAKADLDFEKTEVFQKGVKGKKKVVTKGSEKPVETVLEKPVTEIIGVGNRKVVEEDIKVEGKDAKKVTTTVYEVDKKTGKLINPKSTVKITLKAEEIEDISTKVTKKEESIKFKTTYEADSTLEYGKTKTKVKGKDGKKGITTTTKSGKSEVSEKVIEKPVDEVILVGNKKVETEEIEEKGLKGTKTTTTISEVDKNTGKLINTKVTVKKSLKAGVIEDIATTTKVTKEEIKGKTVYEADDSLEFGKQVVVKKTVDGEKEVTSKTVGGKTTKTEKILKESENGLVKVGNKKVEVETKDGITITTTTVYEVDKETGKLVNPKVSKTTKMGTIEDIAKPIKQDKDTKPQDNKKDDKEQKQKEKDAFIVAQGADTNNKLPSAGVQTGVAGVDYAIVGALLSSIGLGITSKKKKK